MVDAANRNISAHGSRPVTMEDFSAGQGMSKGADVHFAGKVEFVCRMVRALKTMVSTAQRHIVMMTPLQSK